MAKILALVLFEVACGTAAFGAAGNAKDLVVLGVRDLQAPRVAGWMDGYELTSADRDRIASISAVSRGGEPVVDMGRRDFEVLAQDLRRARAAYPDIPLRELTEAVPVGVPFASRVPKRMVSGPVETARDAAGNEYADGVAMVTVVRPAFASRLGASETKAYFAARSGRHAREA